MKSSLLSKAGAVLEAVCRLDHPVAIKELTQMLDMPLPTVSRLCADLVDLRLLEKTSRKDIRRMARRIVKGDSMLSVYTES